MITRPIIDAAARSQILAHIKRGVAVSTAFLLYELDDTQRAAYLDAHPKFHIQVRQAVEYYQTVLLDKIERAADGDWKASAWLLSNHPDQRETFAPAVKTIPVVKVLLMYNRDEPQQTRGKVIDVPVHQLPAPDDA